MEINEILKEAEPEAVASWLTEKGYIARTKEGHDKFLNDELEKTKKQLTNDIHTGYRKDVLELTGIDRNEGEKDYDYMKRAVSTKLHGLQEYEGKVKTLSEQLEDLKKNGVKDKDAFEEVKKREEAIKEQAKKREEELTSKIEQLTSANKQNKVNNVISEAMSKIRSQLKAAEAFGGEKFREDIIATRLETFNKMYKPIIQENGAIIWHDINDKPVMEESTYEPKGAGELLVDTFKDMIDTTRHQGGAGGAGSEGKPGGKPDENKHKLDLPAHIQSQVQLGEWLISEKKIDKNSVDFTTFFNANKEGLKLR